MSLTDSVDVPPFLRLPALLRNLIYAAANVLGGGLQEGVPVWKYRRFINLNNNGSPQDEYRREGFQVTYALLLSCRAIYEEVVPIVYSSNHFFIRYCDTDSLGALNRLSSLAVRSLRRLTVHLRTASCGLGRPCDREVDPWALVKYDKNEEPLCISNAYHQVSHSEMFWGCTC